MTGATGANDTPEAPRASSEQGSSGTTARQTGEIATSQLLDRTVTAPDPHGRRAGTVRVLANALLVLLAYEVVLMVAAAAQMIVAGTPPPATPVEFVTLVAAFVLFRWIFVVPGLVFVLIGLEYIARRAPHARVLTAIVAFAPMVVWELLLTSPGGFPSGEGAILGVTAVLFAVLARLPARSQGRSAEDREAAQPPAGTAVAPR